VIATTEHRIESLPTGSVVPEFLSAAVVISGRESFGQFRIPFDGNHVAELVSAGNH
jgi:hypothetical protein